MKASTRTSIAILAAAVAVTASSAQTITYQYDELGRLKASSQSGGAKNGTSTSIQYDPASNRSNYSVSGSGTTGGDGGGGGGTTNTAPVANSDSISLLEWETAIVNVVANDSDADGDYPLTIQSISDPSGAAYIACPSEAGWSGASAGTYAVSYTIKDNRGATASGTLSVSVSFDGGGCGTVGGEVCQ